MQRSFSVLLVAGLVLSAGCDLATPVAPDAAALRAANTVVPAPAPLVTVAGPGGSLELWPFTSVTLGGPVSDPVNLIFPDVDVRSLRAALMMLDGDRTPVLPPVAPFDCTWKEAMGANQAGYATPSGWTASAIQLECGDYGPIRFHIRMFPAGSWTIANAHFEVLITGTNQHEVLSWELAEQLVTFDLSRAGVLAGAPAPTAPITPSPTFRAINPLVYNGLPLALQLLVGGPPGPVAAPVPMPNDGMATLIPVGAVSHGERMVARRDFVLDFDQTIPKPFCAGPFDYLRVRGPIQFTQQVVVSENGGFMSWFHARGGLELVPVNPFTGEALGDPLMARVAEHDRSVVTDEVTLVSTFQIQLILPQSRPESGSLRATLRIGPGGSDGASVDISCTS